MKKYLRFYLLAIAVVIVVSFFVFNQDNSNRKELAIAPDVSQNATLVENTVAIEVGSHLSNSEPTTVKDEIDVAAPLIALSPDECANFFREMQESVTNDPAYKDYGFWLSNPATREYLDYYHYSEDQLEGLANNDDRTAQHVLADLIQRTNRGRAIYWYKQAAIRGYIYSLTRLAVLIRDEALTEDNEKPNYADQETLIAYKQAREIESLAWLLVSERVMGRSLQKALKVNQGYSLNSEEIERAEALSESFLKSLQKERTKLGLGPFKNRPFPVFRIDNDILKACVTSQNSAKTQ